MKYFFITLFWGIPLFFISSCERSEVRESYSSGSEIKTQNENKQELLSAEYMQWVQNKKNGLKKEKLIDDISFSIQYKPLQYIVCIEEKQKEIHENVLKSKIEELNDMEYYDLKIMLKSAQGELLKHQISSATEYDQRVKHYAFEMQNEIKLVEDNDTIPCSLFHFERAYDAAPYCKFLLGFSKNKEQNSINEKTLIFQDKIFHKGIIKFTFNRKELNNIPKLKTV